MTTTISPKSGRPERGASCTPPTITPCIPAEYSSKAKHLRKEQHSIQRFDHGKQFPRRSPDHGVAKPPNQPSNAHRRMPDVKSFRLGYSIPLSFVPSRCTECPPAMPTRQLIPYSPIDLSSLLFHPLRVDRARHARDKQIRQPNHKRMHCRARFPELDAPAMATTMAAEKYQNTGSDRTLLQLATLILPVALR